MTQSSTDWRSWKRRFALRADRPLPALEADHEYELLPASLARSLAIFQLGESGGGSVVRQARCSRLPGIDDDYADALRYFVAEEHRHANILAMCVRLMHGRLIRSNWTARLFVFARRLMGLRLKVLVLLAAELVGLCFYRLIAERLPPGILQSWLDELVDDERDHLNFHCDFLGSQIHSPAGRVLFIVVWRSVVVASGAIVLLDHRKTLADLYVDRSHVWSRLMALAREAEAQVLAASPSTVARAAQATGVGT